MYSFWVPDGTSMIGPQGRDSMYHKFNAIKMENVGNFYEYQKMVVSLIFSFYLSFLASREFITIQTNCFKMGHQQRTSGHCSRSNAGFRGSTGWKNVVQKYFALAAYAQINRLFSGTSFLGQADEWGLFRKGICANEIHSSVLWAFLYFVFFVNGFYLYLFQLFSISLAKWTRRELEVIFTNIF